MFLVSLSCGGKLSDLWPQNCDSLPTGRRAYKGLLTTLRIYFWTTGDKQQVRGRKNPGKNPSRSPNFLREVSKGALRSEASTWLLARSPHEWKRVPAHGLGASRPGIRQLERQI
jgi:hypothetical protein